MPDIEFFPVPTVTGGSGSPTGAAGGDLAGTYPNPTVPGKANNLVPTAVKTANYTAAAGDFVPVDTTSGSVTITLPTAPTDLMRVGVKHIIQGSTNTVTVASAGSDVFNKTGGSTTLTLSLLNQDVLLQYKAAGAIWYVTATDVPLAQLDLRYPAIEAGVYNVKTGYGAVGNGTTDDTTAIRNAVNAAVSAGGGVVYFPIGNYKTTSAIVFDSGVSFVGAGKYLVTLLPTGADFICLKAPTSFATTRGHDIEFREFGIDGSAQTTAGYNSSIKAIDCNHTDRLVVQNVYIRNTGATGLGIDQLTDATIIGNTIIGCGRLATKTVADAVTNGTTTLTSATFGFSGSDASRRITGTRIPPNTYIASVTNSTTVVMTQAAIGSGSGGSLTRYGAGGSGIGIGTGVSTEGVSVIGNYCLNNANYGIFFENQSGVPGSPQYRGNRVVGNFTSGNYTGIGDCGCFGLVIEGNTSVADTMGISVDPGTINDGSHGYPGREGSIVGNIVRESVLNGIQLAFASNGYGRTLVKDNLVSFAGQHGIYMQTNNQAIHGVRVDNNTVHNSNQNGILWALQTSGTGTYSFCTVNNNLVFDNGRSSVSNNDYGIRIEAPVIDSEIVGNKCHDRASSGKLQTYGIRLTSATAISGGKVSYNDVRKNATGSLVFVTAPSSTTALSANLGYQTPVPATVSVTSSPQTYTANADAPEWLYITGGTVSSVTLGGVTVASSTDVAIPCEPGDSVVITYSSAPTLSNRKR